MADKKSTWCGLSSSSSDEDEEYMDKKKDGKPPKNKKKPSLQRQRSSFHSFGPTSSSSSNDCDSFILRCRSQNELKNQPSSKASAVPSRCTIRQKSPTSSCSKSIRKRPLLRPSKYCGNLSDTSSSSSDDSLIFRSSLSLTSSMQKGSPEDEKSFSKSGYNAGKRIIGENDAIEYRHQGSGSNCSGNNSDSDDTAELVRQLTRKSSPRKKNKFNARPSQPAPGYSSLPSQKPKPTPSNAIILSKTIADRENNNDADDEGSLHEGDRDRNQSTDERNTSNPDSKPPPAKEVCVDSNQEHFSNLNKTPEKSLYDTSESNTDPIGFELPTQSSSSEESSEEEQSSEDEWEEKRNSSNENTNSKNMDAYSIGENLSSKDDENKNDVHRQESQQQMIPYLDNHRNVHKKEQFLTQTNRELFETAFDGNNNNNNEHCAKMTNSDRSEKLSSWNPMNTQASRLLNQNRQQQHQYQQPCIDLVDSDDDEQQMQTQKSAAPHPYQCNESHHRRTGQTFENDESPRSPSRRKSPRFNIAARNFIYNKPWTTNSNYQNEKDEDVFQFEDDDSKVKIRSSRRITQDHTNQIFTHNNCSGDRNAYERSSATSNYFQPRHISNPSTGHKEQPPEQQKVIDTISRPWEEDPGRSRILRDPTTSNISLAASVVVKNITRGGRTASNLTRQSTAERNNASIGDIRTFVSRRPTLVFETRNRAKSIETVRANRHDIQGHANVTVVNHPPKAVGRGSRSRLQEQEDVIEVFDDEPLPVKRSTRSRKATATKAKPKRKRATSTRRTKSRKKGGRKRARKSAGRGFGGKRSGGTNNDDSGAWGTTGGGWTSARPVHKEDPAFQNVGAEIAF